MDPLSAIGAGTQALGGIISGIKGLFQGAKARRLEKENVRPVYNIPGEVTANQQIAQQMSTQGLPVAQYMAGLKNIDRNAATALAATQDRNAGLSSIGAIQQGSNDATLKLTAQDAQQRVANMRNLMAQNNVMAGYRDKAWGWNSQAKFQENAAAIRALKGASEANINAGLNGVIGAGATAAAGSLGGGSGSYGSVSPYSRGYGGQAALMNLLRSRQYPDQSMMIPE